MGAVKAWLAKAWGYLLTAAVAVPALAALYLWGRGWRERARIAERGRQLALDAARIADERRATDTRVRHVQRTQLEALRRRVRSMEAGIDAREAEIGRLRSSAARANAAFGGDDAG